MNDARFSIGGDVEATAGNGTDVRSGIGRDVGDDELAIMSVGGDAGDDSAGNRTNAGSALGGDAGDNGLVVGDDKLADGDDRLAARDDGSSIDNDGSVARIGKRTDVDDGSDTQAGN